jgi:hypothetical protein
MTEFGPIRDMGGSRPSQCKSIVRPSLKRGIVPSLLVHDPPREGHMAIYIQRREFITLLGGAIDRPHNNQNTLGGGPS